MTVSGTVTRSPLESLQPISYLYFRKGFCPVSFFTILILLLPARPLKAGENPDRTAIHVQLENDVMISDQFYTNGFRADFFVEADRQEGDFWNPAYWLFRALKPITGLTDGENNNPSTESPFAAQSSLVTGLDMYTPKYLVKSDIAYGDHPYASWGYIGATYGAKDSRTSLNAEIQVGALGHPASRSAQTIIHKMTEEVSEIPNGWDYQMPYTPGGNINLEYRRSFFPDNSENHSLGVFARPRIGTIYTDLEVGGEARTRFKIPKGFYYPGIAKHRLEFFVRPSLKYVGYNAALEGPMGQKKNVYREDSTAGYLAFYEMTPDFLEDDYPEAGRESLRYAFYHELVAQRNVREYRENFLRFHITFYRNADTNLGEELLIYETLFRETRPYKKEDEVRYLIRDSYARSDTPVNAENILFLSNTYFRKEGESLRPETKWIAFKKLTRDRDLNATEQVVIFGTLFNGHQYVSRPYSVPPIRLVFRSEIGFAFDAGPLQMNVSWFGESGTFENVRGIEDYHAWWKVGATYIL